MVRWAASLMESGHTKAATQASALMRFLVDTSLGTLLVACLAAVHGFDDWRHRVVGISEVQPVPGEVAVTVVDGGSEVPASATATETTPVETVESQATSAPADAPAMPETAESDPPVAPAGEDDVIEQRKPTGIIAGFERFRPELIPQQPPPTPELIQQPSPAPVDPEPTGQIVVQEPQPAKIEFFDTEAKASSVGFVVDCSSSMDGMKFKAVCAELAKSITALRPEQRFFVVFFNEGFYPMTGNAQQPKLLPANRENKRNILAFLCSAQSSGGTNPEPALQFMAGLRPEVIYLLTDGGFSPLNPGTYNSLNTARIVVHTIGFEAGGPIPILQEIAQRTSGTFRSAAMNGATTGLFFAEPRVVRAALNDPDPSIRREAVSVALIRELPIAGELILMLEDSDAAVRTEVHQELRTLAQGTDFGPANAGDVPDAVRRWKLWWSLRKLPRERLLSHLSGDDADARWAAASIARTSGLNAPDELIAAMRGAAAPVWQELHVALVQCCPGKDFGPAPNSTPEQVVEATDRWAAWRTEERERVARELLAKRIKLAAEKLRLARELIDINPEAVLRRCRELMRDFADTPSAAEAKELFDEMGGDESE